MHMNLSLVERSSSGGWAYMQETKGPDDRIGWKEHHGVYFADTSLNAARIDEFPWHLSLRKHFSGNQQPCSPADVREAMINLEYTLNGMPKSVMVALGL